MNHQLVLISDSIFSNLHKRRNKYGVSFIIIQVADIFSYFSEPNGSMRLLFDYAPTILRTLLHRYGEGLEKFPSRSLPIQFARDIAEGMKYLGKLNVRIFQLEHI